MINQAAAFLRNDVISVAPPGHPELVSGLRTLYV
jgi:hypothetical protein